MPRRIDETPVRRRTSIIHEEPSPGTPAQTGKTSRLTILAPVDIQTAKWNTRLRRQLAATVAGPVDGAVTDLLAAIVLNQFNLEDYYPDETLFAVESLGNAPGIGNISRYVFVNQLNSGLLVTIDRVWGFVNVGGAADALRIGLLPAVAAVAGVGPRDSRVGTGVATQGLLGIFTQSAAAMTAGEQERMPLDTVNLRRDVTSGWVLSPGTSLEVATLTTNQTTSVGFVGRFQKNPG